MSRLTPEVDIDRNQFAGAKRAEVRVLRTTGFDEEIIAEDTVDLKQALATDSLGGYDHGARGTFNVHPTRHFAGDRPRARLADSLKVAGPNSVRDLDQPADGLGAVDGRYDAQRCACVYGLGAT